MHNAFYMLFIFDVIVTVAVLLALTAAAFADIKTREIPDWISYGLIFFVGATRILEVIITRDVTLLTTSLLVFGLFAAFGTVMYLTRQWGGGDTKLLAGFGLAFAQAPSYLVVESVLPFPAVILINILLIGALYGAGAAIVLAIKHRKAFKRAFKKEKEVPKMKRMKLMVWCLAVIFGLLTITLNLPQAQQMLFGLLALVLLALPYITIAIKSVEHACMYTSLTPSQLTEGDWIQDDVYKGKKLLYKVKAYGIDKRSIQKLINAKIKKVIVKEGVPFVPSFWIAIVITLLIGDVLFLGLF